VCEKDWRKTQRWVRKGRLGNAAILLCCYLTALRSEEARAAEHLQIIIDIGFNYSSWVVEQVSDMLEGFRQILASTHPVVLKSLYLPFLPLEYDETFPRSFRDSLDKLIETCDKLDIEVILEFRRDSFFDSLILSNFVSRSEIRAGMDGRKHEGQA